MVTLTSPMVTLTSPMVTLFCRFAGVSASAPVVPVIPTRARVARACGKLAA